MVLELYARTNATTAKPVEYEIDGNGCWNVTSHACNRKKFGYPRLAINKKQKLIMRVFWEQEKGSIPEGLNLLHSCDNSLCINLDHLSLGTQDENMKQASKRGRIVAPKGEKNVTAKLTEGDIENIRKEAPNFYRRQHLLAAKYGISRVQLNKIVNRKSWSHV